MGRRLTRMHLDRLGLLAGMHLHAHGFDGATQHLAAEAIELLGHQHRSEFDDMGLQSQCFERARRFQPQQAAADDDAGFALLGRRTDRLEILDGAVNEAFVVLGAVDGRHPGVGAGGEDQGVVADRAALVGVHLLGRAIDLFNRLAQAHLNAMALVEAGFDQAELFTSVVRKVRGEVHPVVGQARLGAEDGDLVFAAVGAVAQLLEEAVADHAVADNDEAVFAVKSHHKVLVRACGSRQAKCLTGINQAPVADRSWPCSSRPAHSPRPPGQASVPACCCSRRCQPRPCTCSCRRRRHGRRR